MAMQYGTATIQVVREIGWGGFGVVDEVEIVESYGFYLPVGHRLARKRLGPQWAPYPAAGRRFDREIETLHVLAGHPNIVTVQGENIGGERFYCMPLCKMSGRQLVEQNPGGLNWRWVARLGVMMARALAYAHARAIIHRDLKPENLLFDHDNNVLLADWGIGYFVHQGSLVLQTKLTALGEHPGTKYYCCNEQWRAASPTPGMDVYALGMTLAELVMGHHLPNFIVGMGVRVDVAPSWSPGARSFNAAIKQMTAFSPAQRTASAEIAASHLEYALSLNDATPGGPYARR